MNKAPVVLVAPLDWGLGHVTRCVSIIKELINSGCRVILACSGSAAILLQKEFPDLDFCSLPAYNIYYQKANKSIQWTIARQLPKMGTVIRQEHAALEAIMGQYKPDIVISDNRFGLSTNKAYTVFITHQLAVKSGWSWMDRYVQQANRRMIKEFDECWVPDFEDSLLTGELTQKAHKIPNLRFIGPLSRLQQTVQPVIYKIVIVLSGPEPRRSIWEADLRKQITATDERILMIRGLPDHGNDKLVKQGNLDIVDYADSRALEQYLQQAEWVLCRSGYTSVMDLVKLQKKAILVPTPQQPEQEYLAKYLKENRIFYSVAEKEFSLVKDLEAASRFTNNFEKFHGFDGYKTAVRELLGKISITLPVPG